MADASESTSRKEWVVRVLLEKGVLALVLVFAGNFFSAQLKHQELVSKYQEGLFRDRLDTYTKLLAAAEHARDVAVAFYTSNPDSVSSGDIDWGWRLQVDRLSEHARRLRSGGGGGSAGWASDDDLLSAITAVVDVRRTGSLYMSNEVAATLDSFLNVLTTDLNSDLSRRGARIGRAAWVDRGAGHRANDAYVRLRRQIRDALRIPEMVVG
jgi:hypothetical protein